MVSILSYRCKKYNFHNWGIDMATFNHNPFWSDLKEKLCWLFSYWSFHLFNPLTYQRFLSIIYDNLCTCDCARARCAKQYLIDVPTDKFLFPRFRCFPCFGPNIFGHLMLNIHLILCSVYSQLIHRKSKFISLLWCTLNKNLQGNESSNLPTLIMKLPIVHSILIFCSFLASFSL